MKKSYRVECVTCDFITKIIVGYKTAHDIMMQHHRQFNHTICLNDGDQEVNEDYFLFIYKDSIYYYAKYHEDEYGFPVDPDLEEWIP